MNTQRNFCTFCRTFPNKPFFTYLLTYLHYYYPQAPLPPLSIPKKPATEATEVSEGRAGEIIGSSGTLKRSLKRRAMFSSEFCLAFCKVPTTILPW